MPSFFSAEIGKTWMFGLSFLTRSMHFSREKLKYGATSI